MNCPNCSKNIVLSNSQCPSCGEDLFLFLNLNSLKQELEHSQANIRESFKRLEFKLISLNNAVISTMGKGKTTSPVLAPKQTEVQSAIAESESEKSDLDSGIELTDPDLNKQYPFPRHGLETTVEKIPSDLAKASNELQLGQKWLLVAGILITVMGVGYFLKYSFDQNWVGPAGRVGMAYLGGLFLLGLGERFRRNDEYLRFGLSLIGGGIATLYFATFAAFQIYDLVGQYVAYFIMILVTALAGGLSLKNDHKSTAILGIIGGFLTPVLLSTGRDNQFALMTYMILLNLGILWLSFLKRWGTLSHLGFIFTWLLFSGWFGRYYNVDKFWLTTFFLNSFFVIYAIVPFAYYYLKRTAEPLSGFGISIPNAAIAMWFSYYTINGYAGLPYVGIVSLLYAGLNLYLAQALYTRNPGNREPLIPYLAQAAVFLIITVPFVFSKHWITIFWTAQALVLFWCAIRLKSENLYKAAFLLIFLTLIKFLSYDITKVFYSDINSYIRTRHFTYLIFERWLTSFSLVGAFIYSAIFLRNNRKAVSFIFDTHLFILWGVSGVLLFYILNCEVVLLFDGSSSAARAAAISVLWAIFSIVTISLGFKFRSAVLRKCALGLFAATVLKVFLIDMANVSTPFRIISFIILGSVLILASYLYYRFKDQLLPRDIEKDENS